MSKVTIVDLNPNDKEQVRNYMTKGERGYSAYELYVQNGGTLTEEEWLDAFLNADNYYNKSEVKGLVIDDLTSTVTDQPLSANQGKALKDLVDTKANSNDIYNKTDSDAKYALKGDFAILTGSVANTELTLGGKQLDYPTGFSQSNCVVIGAMKKNHTLTVWNSYYSEYDSEASRNTVGIMVQMFSDKIKLVTPTDYVNERTSSSEANGYDYRVVLMKIS